MHVVDFAREHGLRVAAQSTGNGAGALPMIDAEHLAFGVGAAFDEPSRAAVEDHLGRLQAELAPTRREGGS